MIIASVAALSVFIVYVSKRWKKLGNEETEEAEEEARHMENTLVIPDSSERILFKEALKKTWKILEDVNTNDIVEFDSPDVACQIGFARSDDDFRMVVVYFPKGSSVELESLDFPMQKEEGLYNLLYMWPNDMELLIFHLRKILNIDDNQYIDFLYWKGNE